MLSGNWAFTGDTFKIDKYGHLSDGAHRCQAVINSGVTVDAIIVYGIEPAATSEIDTHQPRSLSVSSGVARSSVKVYTFLGDYADNGGNFGHTSRDIITFDKSLGGIVALLTPKNCHFYSSAAIRSAAVVSIALGENPEYVRKMYDGLVLGKQCSYQLPPIADALAREGDFYKKHGIPTSAAKPREDIFHIGLYAFKESNKNTSRIKVSPQTAQEFKDATLKLIAKVESGIAIVPSKSLEEAVVQEVTK